MARTNLCPNPGLANDATGWFGGGTRVTGSTGMQRTTAYQNAGIETTLPRGTVTAGLSYRFSAYIKGTGGASSGNANINWYSGGAYLASSPGQGWSVTTGNVTRVESGAQVAPAGADQGLLNITGVDAQIQVTAVLYEQTTSLFEFFDGDSDGCSWTGTSGNSTSTNPVGDSGGDTPPPADSTEAAITQGWGNPIWQSEFTNAAELTNGTWGLYDGPGHGGNGTRDPERISYTGGVLRLQGTAGGSTGGMAHLAVQRQYGRWEARMRAYTTGGTAGQSQYHPVLIVWPDSDNWPDDGEYDFIETDVGSTAGAFIHYPHPYNGNVLQQEHATDSSKAVADYHNYAIDWQPTGITGYIDGVQWYHYANGAGPAGRSNIQAMPSGHLTVQLDNFGGATHRPANMDLEWVKIYSEDSVASNNTITATGIPSAEAFQLPVVGNRFRMYLTNSAAPVTPVVGPSSPWDNTGSAVSKLLGLDRGGSNTTLSIAETSTSNTFDVKFGEWVSQPFTSSGTLQGGYNIVVAGSESDAAADMFQLVIIRAVSGDGTVSRGVAESVFFSTLERGTTDQAFTFGDAMSTPVAVQAGDRLVVEVGYRATNTVATSYSGKIFYGGTAGDIEQGDLSPTITTKSGYFTFTDPGVKALFFGQTITGTGIASAEAFGAITLVQPPTLALSAVGAIPSAEVFGDVTVHAEAAIIAPGGISEEAFGVASVSNTVVVPSITTAEAFGSHRVRRLSDINVDTGIASAEAFGALVLVHYQEVAPAGIESGELFGFTEVEDPHRHLQPFGILPAEEFGNPVLSYRFRSRSIPSAEAFGRPVVAVGFWRLVQPTRIERWRLGDGTPNVVYVTNVVGLTVYGDDDLLSTIENPKTETLDSAKYVWQGGHDNITTDQAIRNLWLANGYQVEMSF